MPLFGRRRHSGPADRQPPSETSALMRAAVTQGWQPVGGPGMGAEFLQSVHRITRALYGVPHGMMTADIAVGDTRLSETLRTSIAGRTVLVGNAWTYIEPALFNAIDHRGVVTVCAAELPSVLPLAYIRPKSVTGLGPRSMEIPTGDPAFDRSYAVSGTTGLPGPIDGFGDVRRMLVPELVQRVLARDDWVFWRESYWLVCVSKGTFHTMAEVSTRVSEVLGIVAAIPHDILPARVDHGADDLVARMSRLNGIEDAIAFLQELTPAERDVLARSDTPLAAFADVRTPEEAMARFESLDPQRRLQIITAFLRVQDQLGPD